MMEFLTEAAKGGDDYFVSGFQRDFKMSTAMGEAWWLGLFLRVESLTCHIWTGAGSRENSGGKQGLAVAPKDFLAFPLRTHCLQVGLAPRTVHDLPRQCHQWDHKEKFSGVQGMLSMGLPHIASSGVQPGSALS